MATSLTTLTTLTGAAVLGLLCPGGAAAAGVDAVEYSHPGVPSQSWALSPLEPSASTRLVLTVAVRQSADGKRMLKQQILARSDPDSPLYSQWLTKAQVDDLVRPAPEAVRAVTDWLERAGATDVDQTTAGDFVRYECG
jgi:hypothetical protein